MQNMKPQVSCDGSKNVLDNIVGCNLFPHGSNEESEFSLDPKIGHKCI